MMAEKFRFTEEDFEKRGGNKDDIQKLRYRFFEFRTEFLRSLDDNIFKFYKMKPSRGEPYDLEDWDKRGGNPYVSKIHRRGSSDLRENLWMGFGRCNYPDENPRKGFQIQVYMCKTKSPNDLFIGIWLEDDVRDEYAAEKIKNNKEEFLKLLQELSGYKVKLRGKDRHFEKEVEDISKEDLEKISNEIQNDNHSVTIGKYYTKDEIIEIGEEIVPHTIKVVDSLGPVYGYLIGEEYKRTPIPVVEVNYDVVQLLKNKKQVILYGPPGTGKTFETKGISYLLLSGDIK